jgi:hypothetical protein
MLPALRSAQDWRGDEGRRSARGAGYPACVPRPLPTWLIAALSLLVGFAVADLTGVRPLGGLVLFGAALWCGLAWMRQRGLPVALGLVAVYLVAFAGSHPLGKAIGSWPAVLVVSALVGAIAWWTIEGGGRRVGTA